jgi:hypothetical protein
MPLPAPPKTAIQSKKFFSAFVLERDDADWPALGKDSRLTIPVGGGYEVVIRLSRHLYESDLYMRRPGVRKLYWMGRDDLAYWPREVLRWEESQLICQAGASLEPAIPHPGIMLLFLYRFTPLTAGDNRKAIHAEMRRAFKSLGILSERTIGRCIREGTSDLTDDFVWWRDEHYGWVLRQKDQDEFWHPRCPDGDFPFTYFNALVDAAQRTCVEGKMRGKRDAKNKGMPATRR